MLNINSRKLPEKKIYEMDEVIRNEICGTCSKRLFSINQPRYLHSDAIKN